jgi:hypothetical protein
MYFGGVFTLTSRGGVIFSLIQAKNLLNLQVKFLVIFKSGESLIFVFFNFIFNLMPDPLKKDLCVVLFKKYRYFESFACILLDFLLSMDQRLNQNNIYFLPLWDI